MYGQAPRSELTGVPGWESPEEQKCLHELALTVPAGGTILEIGGEYGMSTSIFCLAAAGHAQIITIDLFPSELLKQHISNLAEAGFGAGSERIVGDSHEIGLTWHSPIHLLFIDGDHTYEGVKKDIALYTGHVVCGGLVAFHDCANMENTTPHPLHYEVTRAVNEWYSKRGRYWQIVKAVNSMLVFQRICPQR